MSISCNLFCTIWFFIGFGLSLGIGIFLLKAEHSRNKQRLIDAISRQIKEEYEKKIRELKNRFGIFE